MKLTEKMKAVAKIIVAKEDKGITSRELWEKHEKELQKVGISTFNSCNSSASALKDYVSKHKELYGEKVYTCYKATQELIDLLETKEESK